MAFVNKLNVKDTSEPYGIMWPYDSHILEPLNPKIMCRIVSIDVGVKNFAMLVEDRGEKVETVFLDRKDFKETMSGDTSISKDVYYYLTDFLEESKYLWETADYILVEKQLGVNYKCSMIYQHVMSYFFFQAMKNEFLGTLLWVNPKLKGRVLGGQGLNKTGLKKWAVKRAKQLCEEREDDSTIQRIDECIKKKKGDDVSDCIVQSEALWRYLEGRIDIL